VKIAIVGSGAMGSLTGGLLQEAGEDVYLCDVLQDHVERIKQKGLAVEGIGGERTIQVKATRDIEDIGVVDLIIVFVKSYDTQEAAASAARIAGGNTSVLTLQNGIGNVEILEKLFGSEKVLAGTTDAAAAVVAPGRVKHTASGNVYIGRLSGEVTPRVKEIVALFKKAGFNAHPTDNAIGMIWTKLILNLAINAPGTILRANCGRLVDNDYTKELMKQIVDEALQIVKRKKIELIYPDMVQAAYDLAQKNAVSQNSMLQDFLKGKKTEIDFMNGAIVRQGEQIGIDTPVNRAMTCMVKALETTKDRVWGI